MIGIKSVGIYVPENRLDNLEQRVKFGSTEDFILNKIGIRCVSRKGSDENASDLCVGAFKSLRSQTPDLKNDEIDYLMVCTETPDYVIPFTASVVHAKLELSSNCAAFDINLGCSGFVYAISIARSFMEAEGLKNGLVFTADSYSKILDPNDRNTAMIFGDAGAAVLLTENPVLKIGKGVFSTFGNDHDKLIKKSDAPLFMDGRSIFNFVLRNVPSNIKYCLDKNNLATEQVDIWLFHQASLYMVENLAKRLRVDLAKAPFNIENYGNTVSSTIPLLLKDYIDKTDVKTLVMCGFGVGLSIATVVVFRSGNWTHEKID